MTRTFLLLIGLLLSCPAVASVLTYNYLGRNFTSVSGIYTTSDHITGSITIDDSSLVGGTGTISGN
jgi:hypothetical protein